MTHPNGDIAEILKQTAVKPTEPKPESPKPEQKSKSERPPSREGKTGFTVYFDEATHTQLKIMSIEQKTSMHDLMINAVNILFELNNKPPIAS